MTIIADRKTQREIKDWVEKKDAEIASLRAENSELKRNRERACKIISDLAADDLNRLPYDEMGLCYYCEIEPPDEDDGTWLSVPANHKPHCYYRQAREFLATMKEHQNGKTE